jgi:hypothetical protein
LSSRKGPRCALGQPAAGHSRPLEDTVESDTNDPDPLFDMAEWLGSIEAVMAARRLKVTDKIRLSQLPDVLHKLCKWTTIVTISECRELLRGLVDDGLIEKKFCKRFL